ncbi:MAG: helix-turn-helix transcriptional regulator [Lachnospiraceae bacterium]|nr:helix-turn-helix transcriptional regulator [Lachnospiraceae bacterium]
MDKKTTSELQQVLKKIHSGQELENYINNELPPQDSMTFHAYYNAYLEQRHLEKAKVIQISGISRTYAYQILQGEKNPSRDKILALALAAGMDLKNINQCLKMAGMNELYEKVRKDAIILFALNKKLNLTEINELLYEMNEEPFVSL